MKDKILQLKKLNAAYIAALEWDYCPEPKKAKKVKELFDVGISDKELKESLIVNQGSTPYQIADQMSDIIKSL